MRSPQLVCGSLFELLTHHLHFSTLNKTSQLQISKFFERAGRFGFKVIRFFGFRWVIGILHESLSALCGFCRPDRLTNPADISAATARTDKPTPNSPSSLL